MKKLLIVTLSLLIAGGMYSFAKNDADKPHVNASATITEEIMPDYAEINIAVETHDKDVKEAAEINAKYSAKVVNSLKDMLDENRGDTLETVNYSVTPQYTYKDGKSTLTGYFATNTVRVKTKDMQSISAIIDEAISNGATKVSGFRVGYEDESILCNQLYAKATKKAYSQAQSVANALGSKVTGARSVDTYCSLEGQTTRYAKALMSVNADNARSTLNSTPVETGKMTVRATINGVFNIK